MSAKEKRAKEARAPTTAVPGSRGTAASSTLAIKAIPNAPRNAVAGWLGDVLKVKIHAPPVEGRANAALCEFLAEILRVPGRAVTVLRGDTSTRKIIHIAGLTTEAVKARLKVIAP